MITSTLIEYLNESSIISGMRCNTNLILLDQRHTKWMSTHILRCIISWPLYNVLHVICICTLSKVAFTYTGLQLTLFHKQCVCIRMVLGWQNFSHTEVNTRDIRFRAAGRFWKILRRTSKNQQSQHTHWVVLLICDCTGPMSIAVFITEMVALHKYYLFYLSFLLVK